MMQILKQWLMGLVGASILCAAADSLMPPGSVKKVGQFVCGLVLLIMLLKPLDALTGGTAAGFLAEYTLKLEQEEQNLQEQVGRGQKAVIEEHCAAYISDKAAQLGAVCRTEVECVPSEDGLYLPHTVSLWGELSDIQQSRMTELISVELGVPPERQHYYRTKEELP